ncbi:MAG: sterol desaturase family protein [Polyangiaceae bacterium]
MRDLAGFLIAFGAMALVFSLIERLFPSIPGQRRWRSGARTDLVYWLAQPLLFKPIVRAVTAAAVIALALLSGVAADRTSLAEWITRGHGPLARLPLAAQAILALLVADLAGYWVHRLFHTTGLWRFHAVHHSSRELDWLASVRAHPFNELFASIVHALVLVALGFRIEILAGVVPFFTLYAILLHANVRWSFGPLRYVLASPMFHRWHHTSEEEGLDRNFAGLFPLWDLVFGTFHMPVGRAPRTFGVLREQVPEGFLQQLAWPFRAPSPNAHHTPPMTPAPRR